MRWRQAVTTIQQALQQAAASLQTLPHSTPELEAAILLCHLLGKSRSFLYAWPKLGLSEIQARAYQALIQRRLQGDPIAHITGYREFWSLGLQITPATLIPRPETELLVEQGLTQLQGLASAQVADLGTGCGAIALAIASECPACQIDATDISREALAIARANAERLGITNVRFYLGSWFDALPGDTRYDLILSNPPYIAEHDNHLVQGDLACEPRTALASGPDGLNDLRSLSANAGAHLKSGAWLLLEHGFDQAGAIRELLKQQNFIQVRSHRDLAGHERISEGQWQ